MYCEIQPKCISNILVLFFVERGKNAWTHWRAVGLKGGFYERRATDCARCSSYPFYSSEIGYLKGERYNILMRVNSFAKIIYNFLESKKTVFREQNSNVMVNATNLNAGRSLERLAHLRLSIILVCFNTDLPSTWLSWQ